MAFNFLGTFSRAEFEALYAFIEAALPSAQNRIAWHKREIEKLGWIEYTRDESGERTGYSVYPEGSVLANLITAYEWHGGSVLDLAVKSRGDWVYMTQGDFNLSGLSNGGKPSEGRYPKRAGYLDDAVVATHVARLKDWQIPRLKGLEEWEYRVKRCVDRVDQHIEAVVGLVNRTGGAESIEDLREKIEYFLTSPAFPSAK